MTAPKVDTKNLTPEQKVELFNAWAEADWDDVETLPDFSLWPVGSYHIRLTKGTVDREKGSAGIMAEMVACLELANPAEDESKLPAEGAPYSERFFGTFGLSKMKRFFGEISQNMGCRSSVEFLDSCSGLELVATIGHRADRDDKTKIYNELKAVALVA